MSKMLPIDWGEERCGLCGNGHKPDMIWTASKHDIGQREIRIGAQRYVRGYDQMAAVSVTVAHAVKGSEKFSSLYARAPDSACA